MSTIYFIYT